MLEALKAEQDTAAEAAFAAKTAVVYSWQCVVGTEDRPIPWFLLAFLSVLRWILRRLVCGFCGKGWVFSVRSCTSMKSEIIQGHVVIILHFL